MSIGVNIPLLIQRNQARWENMKVLPARLTGLDETAYRLQGSKARFVAVEQRLIKLGYYCPWWFIAICAEREYGGPPHWDRQLSQGDPLNRVSWHDPAGRGPFFGADAWERGCLDALIDCAPHAAKWKDWTPGGTATIWEEYNGLGYAAMGVPSAYVWSGSNQYVSGKYIADHVYRSGVVDVQEGCMPILSRMMAIDATIKFGMPENPNVDPTGTKDAAMFNPAGNPGPLPPLPGDA
jgi:lysozyme family protein